MLLEIQDVSGGYGHGDVVKGVCCCADAGDILCLVGPNGCGKTTLFRLMLGSIGLSKGSIFIDGKDTGKMSPKERASVIAYIPQYHTPIFAYTVLDVVMMGRASHFSSFETPKEIDRQAAFDALEKVNALHLANRKYTTLSGGQRQLILIARAICQSAKIFVMDEPAANLDYANHQLLMDVITDLAKKGYCIVMSTHSPEHPASIGTKVLMMRNGQVAAFGSPEEVINSKNLEAVYGIEMDVITSRDRYGKKRTICLPVKNPTGTKGAAQSTDPIVRLSPRFLPEYNQEQLNHYLRLQEGGFPESAQYTASKWNKRADFWEMERKLLRKNDQRVDAAVEYLTQKGILTPECTIADIGCGPGRFAIAFAQRARWVEGFDISEKMVEYGNAHLQSLNLNNAVLRCCDFGELDIEKEGLTGAFDLVFTSMTPAIHNPQGLCKAMEMSRGWCMNISHVRRDNHLRRQILQEVFHRSVAPRAEGRIFYSLFNSLFLMGYHPETSYITRRKENRVRPDEEYTEYVMEHALSPEEHTAENAAKILSWLQDHVEEDGYLTEISEGVYGQILWNVRQVCNRPDYRLGR